MSDEIYQLISIFIYLAIMLYIGWYSYKRTSNLTDYMLGGRSLGPAVTALSAAYQAVYTLQDLLMHGLL